MAEIGKERVNSSAPNFTVREETEEVVPPAILDKWVIHKHEVPLIQVLVKWLTLHEDNNAREYLLDLLQQFYISTNLLHISWEQEIL